MNIIKTITLFLKHIVSIVNFKKIETKNIEKILKKKDMNGLISVCETSKDYIDVDLELKSSDFSLRFVYSKESEVDAVHYMLLDCTKNPTGLRDEVFCFKTNASLGQIKGKLSSALSRMISNVHNKNLDEFIETTYLACH